MKLSEFGPRLTPHIRAFERPATTFSPLFALLFTNPADHAA